MTEEQMAKLVKAAEAIAERLDSLSESLFAINANLEFLMGETSYGKHFLRTIDIGRNE